MGQTHSDHSCSSATSGRAKWNTNKKARGCRPFRCRSKAKPRSAQLNGNPVKIKVLSCLGRRKRGSSQSEADSGYGNAAADPAAHRGHTVVKLPRDEVVSAGVEHPEAPAGCFENSSGLSDRVEAVQLAVNREPSTDAPGSETRSEEEPTPVREDDASDPSARTMEEQQLRGNDQDRIVSESGVLTRANLSFLTSDPDTERTLPPDQHLDGGLPITDGHSDAKMTKIERTSRSCPTKPDDDQNNSLPTEIKNQEEFEIYQSSPGGQCLSIPTVVITEDTNPSCSQETEPSTGSSLDSHSGDQSPLSDSGCGGSPAQMSVPSRRRCSSLSSTSPLSSFDEDDEDYMTVSKPESPTSSLLSLEDGAGLKHWMNVKNVVRIVPLRKPYKIWKQWVQLAGHEGIFHKKDGLVFKQYCESENQCLQKLMGDILQTFVPQYHGVEEKDGQKYNKIQDLLAEFDNPSIMDCKMGSRTYLEEELTKARQSPCLRKDMYEKMVSVDPEAPTAQERMDQGVVKLRYMQWRESLSSTKELGFRIEGIMKNGNKCRRNFKKTKQKEDVIKIWEYFIDNDIFIMKRYLERLQKLCSTLEQSEFFRTHEVVGSSLLFVHDASGKASVWMIDFGKTAPLPDTISVDHRTPWVEGNREEGYLWGLDHLIEMLGGILSKMSSEGEKAQTTAEKDCLAEEANIYTN